MSLIRGVLLAGNFRTQHELDKISPVDQRNTLIVELAGRTNKPVSHFQAMNDADLAGVGAVLVFLRRGRIRTDAELKSMSPDDQRNTLIVEVGKQTGQGKELQGLSNMGLVLQGLGQGRPGTSLVQPSYLRGVLLAGQFRTQHELDGVSNDGQRNILIVELAGRTNQPVPFFQAMNDFTLAGVGAVLVFLRETKIRTDQELKSISADDQRNILIVEIESQTHLGIPRLQGLRNMDLVRLGLGVDPAVVLKPLPPPLQAPSLQHPNPGKTDGPNNPELGDPHGKGHNGPIGDPPGDPPPEMGPTKNPDNKLPSEKGSPFPPGFDPPPPPTGCFIGATPVLMAGGGEKSIQSIAAGDMVIGRDEQTGATAESAVSRTFVHRVVGTILLQLAGGETIETTAAHRFAVEGQGFVSADLLSLGDRLSTHDGRGAEVISIKTQTGEATVYNLTVDRLHTFFVGGAALWVHNEKKSDPVAPDDPGK
jgi:Pretoxin HINT domain